MTPMLPGRVPRDSFTWETQALVGTCCQCKRCGERDRASDAVKCTPTRSCNGVAIGVGSGEVDWSAILYSARRVQVGQPPIVLRIACSSLALDLGARVLATSIVRI